MRSRLAARAKDGGIKVLNVTSEGVLTVFTKAPIPTKHIKTRHHLQIELEGEKKQTFWDLDQKIAAKVKLFKETQKKLKEFEQRERKRISDNVENWFHNASKLAIG